MESDVSRLQEFTLPSTLTHTMLQRTNSELNALKALVQDALSQKGVLGKIKAELRASVFSVLHEQEIGTGKAYLENQKLAAALATREGQIAVDLIREFLEFFNLEHTLAVFLPEANLPEKYAGREKLANELRISQNRQQPLLLGIVAQPVVPKVTAASAQHPLVGRNIPSLAPSVLASMTPSINAPEHMTETLLPTDESITPVGNKGNLPPTQTPTDTATKIKQIPSKNETTNTEAASSADKTSLSPFRRSPQNSAETLARPSKLGKSLDSIDVEGTGSSMSLSSISDSEKSEGKSEGRNDLDGNLANEELLALKSEQRTSPRWKSDHDLGEDSPKLSEEAPKGVEDGDDGSIAEEILIDEDASDDSELKMTRSKGSESEFATSDRSASPLSSAEFDYIERIE